MRFVVVGGGVAGTTASEELRKLNPEAEIVLVSEETSPLYSRVLLPHYIEGKIPREKLFLKDEQWYADQKIEWLTGLSISKIDPMNKFVELSDGRELPYDKLLIASGAEPRLLADDARGISYLRTLDDAEHLLQLIKTKKDGARGFIYGGGLIASEYLKIFEHFNIPTSVILREKHFWPGSLTQEAGEFISQHLRDRGVEILTEMTLEKVEELDGSVVCVCDKREVTCGILGVGIGTVSDLGWVKTAGIDVQRGIKTDEFLKTNLPDIFAAGDVVEYFDVIAGRHIRFGNWMKAMSQGRVAARNMSGQNKSFRQVTTYATNLLGLDVSFIGDTEAAKAEQIVLRKGGEGLTQIHVRDGRVVGAVVIGRNQDRMQLTKIIDSQEDASDRLEQWKDINIQLN